MAERHPERDQNGFTPWRRLKWFVDTYHISYKELSDELGVATETVKGYVNGYKTHSFAMKHQEKFAARWLDPQKYPGAQRFFTGKAEDEQELENLLLAKGSQEVIRKDPSTVHTNEADSTWYLLGRPAEEIDIASIVAIANDVNIASMVPDEPFQGNKVGKSQATLKKTMSWYDGLLFLVTELCNHPNTHADSLIVGSASLNRGAGGFWKQKKRERHAGNQIVPSEYLTFERLPETESSFEFSSNCVLKPYRNDRILRVGKFQTTSRILFLLMHHQHIADDIGDISFLFGNLLTQQKKDGGFLFYEKVVRPLLGGIPYKEADDRRYADANFLENLLLRRGNRHEGPQLPLHLVDIAIGEKLGVVREETRGAEQALADFGFRQVDKFDALDGGRYMETTFSSLESALRPRRLKSRHAKFEDLRRRKGTTHCHFAPIRPLARFTSARALACEDGDTLLIHDLPFNRLELASGDRVQLVTPPVSTQASN